MVLSKHSPETYISTLTDGHPYVPSRNRQHKPIVLTFESLLYTHHLNKLFANGEMFAHPLKYCVCYLLYFFLKTCQLQV